MAKEYKDLVVGLDIGTAKVMAVVAEVMPGGELKLAGLGVAPSNGLKRGVVVNIDATVQSIQQALKEAELMADCKITRVWTGITGSHIRGINSSGMVAVKDREVTPAGVACVDIGAGTTDVAIFTGGAIRHTAVIPIAGDLITSDIAMALRTPTKDAEEIKVEYGVAKQLLADPSEQLEVPGLGDRAPRMLSRQALAGVIEPRVEEIYSLVHQVIRESGYEELLSSGIVISGGAAVMPGMVELGEDIFLKPVRKGVPKYASALSDMVAQPRASTVMGLLEEARLARTRGLRAAQPAGSVKTLVGRAKDWFLGNF